MNKPPAANRHRVSPPWIAPLILGVACTLALLALVAEGGPYDPGAARGPVTPLSAALCAVYILAWGCELAGLLPSRWLFAALSLLPAAWLLYGGRDTLAPLLPMVVAWWLAYTGTRRQALLGLALVFLSLAPPFVSGRGAYDNWVSWSMGALFSWLSGFALAMQRQTLAALRAAQADLARQAVADERHRLARELHDVVAHTLAVTMLQLTGARRTLQRDPARAAEALARAEELGRQSLADLRRAVSLLADGPADGRGAPALGAADIPALADEFARAGMPLTTRIDGSLDALPAGLGLDLYRMAQEALANAAKHAPGQPVDLALAVGPAAVELRVENGLARANGRPAADGRGLLGMQSRAASHGGSVSAGRDHERWRVAVRLPLDGGAATQHEVHQ